MSMWLSAEINLSAIERSCFAIAADAQTGFPVLISHDANPAFPQGQALGQGLAGSGQID
jgi:hypothetical protein